MKKKIITIITIIFIIILSIFTITTYIYKNDNRRFRFEYNIYNYFKFENGKRITTNIDKNINIIYLEKEDIIKTLNSSKTYVLYLGYSYCPWCRNVLPILLESLKDNNMNDLYYINVNNLDKEEIKFIKNKFNIKDKDIFYVPEIYFINKGNIKFHHTGSINSYKNPFIKIDKKQKQELKDIYQKGFNLIKKEGIK